MVAEHFGIPYKTAASRFTRIRDHFKAKGVQLTEEAQGQVKASKEAKKAPIIRPTPPKRKRVADESDDETTLRPVMEYLADDPEETPSKRAPGHSLQYSEGDGKEDDDIELDDDNEYMYAAE